MFLSSKIPSAKSSYDHVLLSSWRRRLSYHLSSSCLPGQDWKALAHDNTDSSVVLRVADKVVSSASLHEQDQLVLTDYSSASSELIKVANDIGGTVPTLGS